MKIDIDDSLSMELISEEHAGALIDVINLNRLYLKKWLPWLDVMTTLEESHKFIATAIAQYDVFGFPIFALRYKGNICGLNGFTKFEKIHGFANLGYWIDEFHTGKGIATKTCQELLRVGFDDCDLHKIELRIAEKNTQSRAVADRLGFTFEAVLRDCEWLYDHHVDHAVYSMTRPEYQQRLAHAG